MLALTVRPGLAHSACVQEVDLEAGRIRVARGFAAPS